MSIIINPQIIRLGALINVNINNMFMGVCVSVCVCVSVLLLTYVDSPTEALHEQQYKYMKRNEVDDEHVTPPSWNLWNKQSVFNGSIFLLIQQPLIQH